MNGSTREMTLGEVVERLPSGHSARKEYDRLRASQGGGVPEGWKLVPVEPTKAMTDAWWREHFSEGPTSDLDTYAAMLAASPQPPASQEVGAAAPTLGNWLKDFVAKQEPLGAEFAEVLEANSYELYQQSREPGAAASQEDQPKVGGDELLPCPFCGGSANFKEEHRAHWRVVCMQCGIEHPHLSAREVDPRPALIAAWNRRALTPAVEADRDQTEFLKSTLRAALQWHEDNRVAIQKIGPGTIPQWVCDGWAVYAALLSLKQQENGDNA